MTRERAGHRSGAHRIASTLGPDARALLDAARGGDDPSPSDRARTRDALMAAIAGATLTSAAATASAASGGGATASTVIGGATASTVIGGATASTVVGGVSTGATVVAAGTAAGASVLVVPVAMKVAALVFAMSATGAIALGVWSVGPPDPSPTASVAPASQAAPARVAPARSTSIDDASRTVAPSLPEPRVVPARAPLELAPIDSPAPRIESVVRIRRDRVARPADHPPEPAPIASPVVSTLADEIVLIRAAWAHLRAGRGDAALASLDAHCSRFPDGVLAPERDAARAIALCASAPREEGLAAASSFLHAHPRSPLAARVRDACR